MAFVNRAEKNHLSPYAFIVHMVRAPFVVGTLGYMLEACIRI